MHRRTQSITVCGPVIVSQSQSHSWVFFTSLGFGRLSIHALATNATHAPGYAELDVHNLWGLMEERATHIAVQDIIPGKRPFLISRSTFPSAGKWTGHWVRALYIVSSVVCRI